jgi:hypothetical protein
MRYALHSDTPERRLATYVIEAKSRDPQQAQSELRVGVAAANESFIWDHGHPLLLGNVTWRCEFIGD